MYMYMYVYVDTVSYTCRYLQWYVHVQYGDLYFHIVKTTEALKWPRVYGRLSYCVLCCRPWSGL